MSHCKAQIAGFTTEDVVRVTQELWGPMLNIDLQHVHEPVPKLRSALVACVHIVGDWMGTIRMDISADLAKKAAASSLGVPADQVSRYQIRDCAGELGNITAGSLKELLPVPCSISLPIVADGRDFTFQVQCGRAIIETVFDWQGEKCIITVFEAERRR